MRRIKTSFWEKPMPVRQFDWIAWFDDDEPDDNGNMCIGYGATEAEAITDLLEK